MKVGYIGLGSLGAGIARRIAESGFELAACDIRPEALEAFDVPGVRKTTDAIAAAQGADVVCVCVLMDDHLRSVVAEGALFQALGRGGLLIINSTVSPDLCRELAEQAKPHGVQVIDAGVSGGAPAALRGELSMYVGGEAAAIDRARPLFDCCAKSLLVLGPVGRGMEGKLLNNLVSIANYGMSAAILDLGETLGFDREELRQALMAGSAESFALRAVPGLLRTPEGAAGLRQLLGKDLDHARELAPASDRSMAALVRAAESMLERLELAAAGKDGRAPKASPADLARRYFEHMRSRDLDGLSDLFAEDAVAILPDGREVQGVAAIRGMYQHIFGAGAPSPTPLATIEGASGAAVEIEARLPDGTVRRTANFFHLDAQGRIARLSIYKRGDW